jgi:hypothetical protein
MPKASKKTASEHEKLEGYEGHFEHFEDGWTVGFETYTEDADLAPLFKGLPNDECQCEHMGYVIKGKVAFRSGTARRSSRPATRITSGRGTPRSSMPAPRWSSSARQLSCTGPWRLSPRTWRRRSPRSRRDARALAGVPGPRDGDVVTLRSQIGRSRNECEPVRQRHP